MATTHLFVELLVIGIGALLALFLVLAGFLGWSPSMLPGLLALETLFPALAIVYVLGILVDRLADVLVDRKDKAQRREVFKREDGSFVEDDYFKARRTLVLDGENLWRDLEYVRSRSRICRGWVLDSILLILSLLVYQMTSLVSQCMGLEAHPFGFLELGMMIVFLLVLGRGCWWCWARLNLNEYKKTQRIAEWLADQKVDTTRASWFMDKVSQKVETEVYRIYEEHLKEAPQQNGEQEG